MAEFDWHIMWGDRVIDRATNEIVALRRMRYLYYNGEAGVTKKCALSLIYVPSGERVARTGKIVGHGEGLHYLGREAA